MSEKIVTGWYESIYDVVENIKGRGLVLCGDGIWSKYAVDIMALFGVIPECICYIENKNADDKTKIPHIHYYDAVQKYPDCIYISCADSTSGRDRWNRLLKEDGLLTKESGLLFWRYAFLLDTGINYDPIRNENCKITPDKCSNLFIFNHMLHSGSGYFQELIDGHDDILTIPTLSSKWIKIYKNRLSRLEGERLIMEICAQMAKYFDTSLDRKGIFPESVTLHTQDGYFGENGEFDWDICIDPGDFYACLKTIVQKGKKYTFGGLLKLIFSAYGNCVREKYKSKNKYWIAYDLHNPSTCFSELDEFKLDNEFEDIMYCCLIREPMQHLDAIMRAYVIDASDNKKKFMLNLGRVKKYIRTECGDYLKDDGKNVFVIRFEDLKHDHRSIMKQIAARMHVSWLESMEDTTINGRIMYIRKRESDGSFTYVAGHDASSIEKNVSDIFTEFDQKRLNYLFSNFIKQYYPKKRDVIEQYNLETMIKPYAFINLIIREIIKTGDVNDEAKRFQDEIYDLIKEHVKMLSDTITLYPLLKYCKSK